jgi:hypothetical protein
MVYDLSQIETRDLRLCDVCRAEPHERDKFCRRCGARLNALDVTQSVGAASSSTRVTSSFPQDMCLMFSGRLLAAVVTGISPRIAPLHSASLAARRIRHSQNDLEADLSFMI